MFCKTNYYVVAVTLIVSSLYKKNTLEFDGKSSLQLFHQLFI